MESNWTWDHFLFDLVVQVLSILISAYIGWCIWKKQFKVTKDDGTIQKNIEENNRLQSLLMQCVLTATDNRRFLEEALRFQHYSAAPFEVKSKIAGLQYALKFDTISNL